MDIIASKPRFNREEVHSVWTVKLYCFSALWQRTYILTASIQPQIQFLAQDMRYVQKKCHKTIEIALISSPCCEFCLLNNDTSLLIGYLSL